MWKRGVRAGVVVMRVRVRVTKDVVHILHIHTQLYVLGFVLGLVRLGVMDFCLV